MKIFNIEGFDIAIDDDLYEKAIESDVLSEYDDRYNTSYLKNCIRSNLCENLSDLEKYDLKDVFQKYSSEEISKIIESSISKDIDDLVL